MLLDFDGTLVPLVNDPDRVRLDPAVRQLLRRLANHPRLAVHVISGRRVANLRKVVLVPGVNLLGLHGWEKPGAVLPIEQQRSLLEAKRWLKPRLPVSRYVRLEDKGLALAVHHRGAPPSAARLAKRLTVEACERFRPALTVMPGRKLWELLPAAVGGKGEATTRLLKDLSHRALPIFIGDDASDEMAFAALRNGNGNALTVHVGGRTRTKARFWLRNPIEVRRFLEKLELAINGNSR